MSLPEIISALQTALPPVMRWSGAVAKRLRTFNIAVSGKSSGNANTDALTLADLSVQELLVARCVMPIRFCEHVESREKKRRATWSDSRRIRRWQSRSIRSTAQSSIAIERAMDIRSLFICTTPKHRITRWCLHPRWAERNMGRSHAE